MKKKTCKIAFVSNSRAVAQSLGTLAPAQGMEIEVHFAAMERAVSVARSLFDRGVDVVLGCGATGRMLAKHLDHPVINVSASYLDFMRALQRARQHSSVVAMPFYDEVPEGLGVLADVLQLRLTPVIFHDTASLISSISSCVDQGVRCIVGSNIAVEIARAQGCLGVEVLYSEREILRSLREAVMLVAAQTRNDLYKAMLFSVSEMVPERGVVGIDDEGRILLWNSRATSMLNCNQYEDEAQTQLLALGMAATLQQGRGRATQVKGGDQRLRASTVLVTVEGSTCGVLAVVQPLFEKAPREASREASFKSRYTLDDLVGRAPVMLSMLERARLYAQTDAALLLHGETGTGKELLAHAIHAASPRHQAPFVALNCAALTESLLESELFGYEEGAFTGARRGGKDGIFVLAQGGTVFLDEIADISPGVQVRLLRVLEAKEVRRVGGERNISVDVRVISSSWKKLMLEVRAGRFRADLFYRLSVLSLDMPSLRERLEDIPLIAEAILKRRGLTDKRLSARAFRALEDYAWPGNIRELDALLQRYCLLLRDNGPDDGLLRTLLEELRLTAGLSEQEASVGFVDAAASPVGAAAQAVDVRPAGGSLKQQLDGYERLVIKKTLEDTRFNRVLTAKKLGISANTLWRKMRGIDE